MTSRFTRTKTTIPESTEEVHVAPMRSGPRPASIASRKALARSPEEAEARYVSARDAWADAMRASASGKASDLAALAIAQEEYEAAMVERDRWQTNQRVAIPVEAAEGRSSIHAVVGQELAWRRVHEQEPGRPGLFGRIVRRLRGD